MALVVSVSVKVESDYTECVRVERVESVQAVGLADPDQLVTQRDVDLVDLARAALDRLAADVIATADGQVGQLRQVLEGAVE